MRFRFSGHESFPCRYTWLPKAFLAVQKDPNIFSDDNSAMVRLGVGKNMVKSIRFWIQVFGTAKVNVENGELSATFFGQKLLQENGLDPFLEDIKTLWLLHWKVSSITDDPLFAWYYLLNQWPNPTFSQSQIIEAFTRESERIERSLSDFTKQQHFDIFLHTYVPVRPKKGNEVLEDSLDCPLIELGLVSVAGERLVNDSTRREAVYEFRQDGKNEISDSLFVYCLFDFWRMNRLNETTIPFRDVSASAGSLGQIFKFSEQEIRSRLERLKEYSGGVFEYVPSAAVPRIIRHCDFNEHTEALLLDAVYGIKSPQKKLVKKVKAVQ